MGVFTNTDEYTSPVPPARLFKALVLDAHNLIPKIMPQAVRSIEVIQGDGGAGSIWQINFAEGSRFSSVKHRIDEVDEETSSYKYTVIEGEALGYKLEFIAHEVQFEPTPDNGSKTKLTTKFHTRGDIVITEEEIKAAKERVLVIFKAAEGYLRQNPEAYA